MNRIYRHILTVMAVSWLAVAGILPVYAAAIVPSRICSDVCQAADVPQVTGGDGSRSDKVVLTMEECRSMALRNNAAVRNAQLDVIAARAQKGEALSEYFPKVSVNVFGYYAFDPMLEVGVKDILGDSDAANNLNSWVSQIAPLYGIDPVFSTMKQGYSATVSAVQPVFAGGRIVSGNRLASLGVEAARLKSSLQRRKSVEEVEQDYWQVISLEEKMKTLGSVQEMLDNLEKDVDAAVAAGLATETDRLRLQLKRNELRATRSKLKGGIRLAKMNLCNAIGLEYTPYSTFMTDSLPFIDSIVLADGLVGIEDPAVYWKDENEILASREESRLLDISVQAKRMEKRMVLGEVLPQVGVGVSYGYNDMMFNDARFNGAVFATLKIPLSDWGKYSRRLQRYDSQLRKTENDREYLDAQLLLQIRQQWLDLTVSWEQAKVAEESVQAAQATVDDMTAHYRAGLVPLSDLLEAQTSLRRSADALVDARIACLTALSRYRSLASAQD